MNITMDDVSANDPQFAALWAEAWGVVLLSGDTDYSAAPPFGGPLDIAWLIRVDGEPAGIRAYHDWGNGTAQGRMTYVRPNFQRQGICDATWEMTVERLKARGITRLVYTVLASAYAMKAVCAKRGDRIRSYQYERSL